jgi:hypothetical protein
MRIRADRASRTRAKCKESYPVGKKRAMFRAPRRAAGGAGQGLLRSPPRNRIRQIGLVPCKAYGIYALATYMSFMSGNTTQTGVLTGQGKFAAALPSALALVSFVAGSIAGT